MVELALLTLAVLVLLSWLLLGLGVLRRGKAAPRRRGRKARKPLAVLDGSNVMHWQDGKPQFAPLLEVLDQAEALGYEVGVIFDANAGHLLAGRYMHDHHFRKELDLHGDRVLVVPKGQQADPFLLRYASENDAVIISNDRFRDRIEDYPALAAPGRLARGGYRDGALWLDLDPPPEPRSARHQPGRR